MGAGVRGSRPASLAQRLLATAPMSNELAVYRVGPDPAEIVFLHGLLGQGRNWFTIAKGLAPTSGLLVDLPHHGRSGRSRPITYPDLAEEVADLLTDSGTVHRPVTLVGHSMGGKVAMSIALAYPGLVGRLVVVDIAPAQVDPAGFGPYLDAMLAIDLDRLEDRQQAEQQLMAAAPDPTVRGFLLQNLRRSQQGWFWSANLTGQRAALDQIGGWQTPTGPAYDGPVLWLAGQQSTYVRREQLPQMRALFPRVRLVTVKNAGHWVHADQPQVTIDLLRRFLAG